MPVASRYRVKNSSIAGLSQAANAQFHDATRPWIVPAGWTKLGYDGTRSQLPCFNTMSTISISPFQHDDADGLIKLVLPIQQAEFGIAITLEDQPDLLDTATFFQHGAGNLWVAKTGNEVIGSIGLLDIGQRQTALRKMFVKDGYRGAAYGVAAGLLATLLAHCRRQQVQQVYLGTTSAYLAAHRFYEKNGFQEVQKAELPASFPLVKVDSKFYCYTL